MGTPDVEYKLIYKAYTHNELVGRTQEFRYTGGSEAGVQVAVVREAKAWSETLNGAAKQGFRVRESGILQLTDSILFWALLERSY